MHTDTQVAVSLSCPSVRTYTRAELCIAAAEAEEIKKYFPTTAGIQIDAQVMRNQSRVCRGMPVPKAKPGAACKLPAGYKPVKLERVPEPPAPAAAPLPPEDAEPDWLAALKKDLQ